ncbi:MAG: NERD domain-containing protein [Verrucomicrobia bacterium]|nr:NERD domain-containing protein [Verrucomicrobiota bacterium]
MAQVLGQSGRYVSQQAGRLRRQIIYRAGAFIAFLGIIQGLLLSPYFPVAQLSPLPSFLLTLALVALLIGLTHYLEHHLDALQQKRRQHERGLAGESRVARLLAKLPDAFHVINNLTTPFGNLDHVVVGPTGVFILDPKNWRGLVTADGKGDLRLNGRPLDKPQIRPFVARLMNVRDKVRTLASAVDPYHQAAFVFTAASVAAPWGSTGRVHCLTDDQLQDYLVNKDFGKRLTPDQVRQLTQAFVALATMDREFVPESNVRLSQPPHAPRPSTICDPQSSIRLTRPTPSRV